MTYIPLAIPNVGQEEARNLQQCVDTNFVSSVGAFVDRFEREVASLSGSEYGVAMGAGTQALHMALHALGVGVGDLVLLPSFTFIASANAISHTGARPWLFDVAAESWTLDVEQVRSALRMCNRDEAGWLRHPETHERVRAIMPVYTLGTPADMVGLRELADEFGLPIVADAAAAIGVKYNGAPIGEFADLTCYSFNGNKTITCGGGGMVVGSDAELLKKIKHISTTARTSKNYDHDVVGFNYRMTNLQAAVGCAQLEKLSSFLDAKKRIRQFYDAGLKHIPEIELFPSVQDRTSTYWFSGFYFKERNAALLNKFINFMATNHCEVRPFWKPVHLQHPYADCPKQSLGYSTDIYDRIITLPCSTNLTVEEQETVISLIHTFFGE